MWYINLSILFDLACTLPHHATEGGWFRAKWSNLHWIESPWWSKSVRITKVSHTWRASSRSEHLPQTIVRTSELLMAACMPQNYKKNILLIWTNCCKILCFFFSRSICVLNIIVMQNKTTAIACLSFLLFTNGRTVYVGILKVIDITLNLCAFRSLRNVKKCAKIVYS